MEGAVKEHTDRTGTLYSPVFSAETAAKVFERILDAHGTFSAGHAYSCARLTFRTAWLRAHDPETFQRVLDETQPRRQRPVRA
jgi:DNA polymerase III alpha subunit